MDMSAALSAKQAEQVSLQVSPQAILDEMSERLAYASTWQALTWIDVSGFKNGGNPVAPRSRDEFLPELLDRLHATNELIRSVATAVRVLKERIEE